MSARLGVRVQPGAKAEGLEGQMADGTIKVKVTEPAREGRANRAVEALLAKRLGVRRSAVRVVGGAASRTKVVEVQGLDSADLAERVAAALRGSGSKS